VLIGAVFITEGVDVLWSGRAQSHIIITSRAKFLAPRSVVLTDHFAVPFVLTGIFAIPFVLTDLAVFMSIQVNGGAVS
jgi:hypothetical protein